MARKLQTLAVVEASGGGCGGGGGGGGRSHGNVGRCGGCAALPGCIGRDISAMEDGCLNEGRAFPGARKFPAWCCGGYIKEEAHDCGTLGEDEDIKVSELIARTGVATPLRVCIPDEPCKHDVCVVSDVMDDEVTGVTVPLHTDVWYCPMIGGWPVVGLTCAFAAVISRGDETVTLEGDMALLCGEIPIPGFGVQCT